MGLVHPCVSYEFVPVCCSSSCVHHRNLKATFLGLQESSVFSVVSPPSPITYHFLFSCNCAMTQAVNFLPVTGLGSVPGQCMWNMWWVKWNWDRFYSEYFSFPLLVLFHKCSVHTFHHPPPVLYVFMTDSFMATLSSLVPHMLYFRWAREKI